MIKEIMGKVVLSVVAFFMLSTVAIFVAIAYDMEVLSTGGRDTVVLSERVDGSQEVVAVSHEGDEPSAIYPAYTVTFEADQITVTLWGHESYLGKNLNAWLIQRMDPKANNMGLYRNRATGSLIIH